MRSHANIKGHPIHPMLIPLPIGFLVGCVIADLVGYFGDWSLGWTMAGYLNLATIVTGLMAGIPGFLDYLYTIPANSSAKRRAEWHMGVNLTALALFGLSWLFRDSDTWHPGVGTLLLEVAGAGLLSAGGWLGGTLAYRNQVGVDHRYADAGKWKEMVVEGKPGEKVTVAKTDELEVGHMKLLRSGSQRWVLARTEEGYRVFDDHCTHRGGPLSGGMMICGTVACPWHGSQFSAHDGGVKAGPAEHSIRTYRVEEVGGEVRLVLPLGV